MTFDHIQSHDSFEKPSAIQQRAIIPCIQGSIFLSLHMNLLSDHLGRDVIAQAQSGTGKTATFAISILQQLDVSKMACQALVLAPTRELAQQVVPLTSSISSPSLPSPQIQKVVIALGDYLDAQCHACIGGTNVRADIAKLEMGQHIVVGTPGRVLDMISRRALGE